MHFEDSAALVRWVAAEHQSSLVGFSGGKDSCAVWLRLRREAPDLRLIPYFCYRVPGLRFIEDTLEYFEERFGCRILRLPDPWLYKALDDNLFQPDDRAEVFNRIRLPTFDYPTLYRLIREDQGLPADCPVATGVRAEDSPYRRLALNTHGPYQPGTGLWNPIYDWLQPQVEALIAESGLRLPPDYRIWGRSWDGIDYRYLAPLKEHYPEDYRRVLNWFPLAEADLYRRKFRENYHATRAQGRANPRP